MEIKKTKAMYLVCLYMFVKIVLRFYILRLKTITILNEKINKTTNKDKTFTQENIL